MTTETTRRALVAGLALAPIAGVPAIAGAVAGNDPALAAIAEYERRCAIAEAAYKASSEADRAFRAAREAIGVVNFNGEEVYSLRRLDFLGQRLHPAPDPEYQAARIALQANLPAYRKAKINNRVAALEAAASEASSKADDAQIAMFETTPRSPAGAAALIRHAMDHLDELGINDTWLQDIFTDAIRNAVAVLERGEA